MEKLQRYDQMAWLNMSSLEPFMSSGLEERANLAQLVDLYEVNVVVEWKLNER